MRTLFLNLLSILRRFRVATVLNIAGLAVAFAAFLIILMQVRFEQQFDACHAQSDRIFQLYGVYEGKGNHVYPQPMLETLFRSSPHVKAATLLCPFLGEVYFTVESDGLRRGFREKAYSCQASITDIFTFDLKEGDAHCLEQPGQVLIPESMARRMFGDGSVIGRSLHAEQDVYTSSQTDFVVGGVYRDFPGNTQLENVIYLPVDRNIYASNDMSFVFTSYVLLDNPETAADVISNFNQSEYMRNSNWDSEFRLVAIQDMYYSRETKGMKHGDRTIAQLLLAIAFLVIVVAAVNFTNFNTAMVPMRVKSINTQMVLGGSQSRLRNALLMETMLIALVAFLVSVWLVWLLNHLQWLPFVSADLTLVRNLPVCLTGLVVAVVTGTIAGLYPSWYATSFPPALALKGSFGVSPAGRRLRVALIGFQFLVSFVLITSSIFVQRQNGEMRNVSLGFEKDNVGVVQLSRQIAGERRTTFASQLESDPAIQDVAFANVKLGSQDFYSMTGGMIRDRQFGSLPTLWVSANFLPVMGIPLQAGTLSSEADEKGDMVYLYANMKALREYDLQIGDPVSFVWGAKGVIRGFVDEVKYNSFRQETGPMVFAVGGGVELSYAYVREQKTANSADVSTRIEAVCAQLDPEYPFQLEYYTTIQSHLYKQEGNLNRMITLFSLLAVIISMVGVFGLVVFETQYRRKEIGIRKVHGATVGEVLTLFARAYSGILVICFLISIPLVWKGLSLWLADFSYKTPLHWWIFALAFLCVAAVTVSTVVFQGWQSANENPVNSIKSE